MYKQILVAVDGSVHSKRAASHAVFLANSTEGSHVTLLYVLDYDKARSNDIHNMSSEDLHIDRKNKIMPIKELFTSKGISTEIKLLHGEAGPVIVEHANQENYDVVVIGSRGLNTLQEMVLGSVSHKVAKRVNSPVLLIK
ncbi:universal stress protein [Paenisporosarcina antarctica]|uniref:Universal stress protein n=1 Tax=Paenisporosarcina antarctica TaxID=417367 RepID=A0A4P6ZU54_9BACL|nr:universal stress protein [Paenisporosarcina antarctica]QBP40000.1 universal stress protein [Paenisporosarcina antarctica]